MIATNGGAQDLDDLIDLKKSVSLDNADVGSTAFVNNSKVEKAISNLIKKIRDQQCNS